MKKVLAGVCCLVVLVLALSLLPGGVYAAEEIASGTCGDNLSWSLTGDGILTITGSGEMKSYSGFSSSAPWQAYQNDIAAVILQEGVTGIGNYAFADCVALLEVTIPESVTEIGQAAFQNCASLTAISLPDSICKIGDSAFNNCSKLTGITIPTGVTKIYSYTFCYCSSLTEVVLPEGLTEIGAYAFFGCRTLPALSVPQSVTKIGWYAFGDCKKLAGIVLPDGLTELGGEVFYDCDSLTAITVPEQVSSIGNGAFSACDNLAGIYADADNAYYCSDEKGVLYTKDKTRLIAAPGMLSGDYAIPQGVTSIASDAFEECVSLTGITIPVGVTAIEEHTFFGCTGLKYVQIPQGVTEIDYYAFRQCDRLTEIVLPEGLTTISVWAFAHCDSLTNVTLPSTLSTIDECAFIGCGLTQIALPEGLTTIGSSAFSACKSLTEITIPKSVSSIDLFAFSYCDSLTGIYVEEGNENYCNDAQGILYNEDQTTLLAAPGALSSYCVVPESVTAISPNAFEGCKGLVGIVIPEGLNAIAGAAFFNCKLEAVLYKGTEATREEITFGYGNNALTNAQWHYVVEKNVQGMDLYDCTECALYFHLDGTPVEHNYKNGLCTICGEISFPDVSSGAWYYNSVKFAVQKGYFTGYKSGNFGPDDKITRQDFVVVLARVAGVDLSQYSGRTGFPDVKAGDYYEKAVKWASSNGIVNGYKNGNFGVGDSITREQLVTILYNFAKKNGYDVSVPESAAAKLSAYTDAYKITGYARNAVIWALHKGVISGMTATTIAPQNTASRAQTATILMNISKKGIMEI